MDDNLLQKKNLPHWFQERMQAVREDMQAHVAESLRQRGPH
jgi:hypothetical protein